MRCGAACKSQRHTTSRWPDGDHRIRLPDKGLDGARDGTSLQDRLRSRLACLSRAANSVDSRFEAEACQAKCGRFYRPLNRCRGTNRAPGAVEESDLRLPALTEVAMSEFRTERDSIGEVRVPDRAYYGAQTQRAVVNSRISGRPLPVALVHA